MVKLFTISTRHIKAIRETKNMKKARACSPVEDASGIIVGRNMHRIPVGKEIKNSSFTSRRYFLEYSCESLIVGLCKKKVFMVSYRKDARRLNKSAIIVSFILNFLSSLLGMAVPAHKIIGESQQIYNTTISGSNPDNPCPHIIKRGGVYENRSSSAFSYRW